MCSDGEECVRKAWVGTARLLEANMFLAGERETVVGVSNDEVCYLGMISVVPFITTLPLAISHTHTHTRFHLFPSVFRPNSQKVAM